jgi:hypothetical protein
LRGAQGSAGALGRELAARDGHAAGQAAELATLREAHSKSQAQLSQSALDVQVTNLRYKSQILLLHCTALAFKLGTFIVPKFSAGLMTLNVMSA